MERSTVVQFECEVCGQFGNNPQFYNNLALCRFDYWRLSSVEEGKRTQRQYRQFKKLLGKFKGD